LLRRAMGKKKVSEMVKHRNIFTLLVSVLLSAQCTDVNVNNVTKNIYPKYNKPEHFVKLGRKKIERLIKSIGIFRVKAKSVYLLSKQLIEKHGGEIRMASELGLGTTFWFDLALAQSDKDELLTKAINNSNSFPGSEINEII